MFYPENNTLDFDCEGCKPIVWLGKILIIHYLVFSPICVLSVVPRLCRLFVNYFFNKDSDQEETKQSRNNLGPLMFTSPFNALNLKRNSLSMNKTRTSILVEYLGPILSQFVSTFVKRSYLYFK